VARSRTLASSVYALTATGRGSIATRIFPSALQLRRPDDYGYRDAIRHGDASLPGQAHLTDERHLTSRGRRVADRRCREPCVRPLRERGTGLLRDGGELLVRRLHVESY